MHMDDMHMNGIKKIIIVQSLTLFMCYVSSASPQVLEDTLKKLNKPLVCTREGIEDFFTNSFNHRTYGQLFLPSSFVHLIDFLNYGHNTKSPYSYYATTCDLFQMRLKESSWVNPYALAHLINTLGEKLKPLCTNSLLHTSPYNKIRGTLHKTFLVDYQLLQKNPDQLLDKLTHDIIALTSADEELRDNISLVQESVTRLLETALDKLIWNPLEQEQTWECCKFIADQLFMLGEYNIIPSNKALNRCYWSLLYRYCYFIETTGTQLTLQTYQKIKTDCARGNIALLSLTSYDKQRTHKKDRLEGALFEGEVRIRTDSIAPYYNELAPLPQKPL